MSIKGTLVTKTESTRELYRKIFAMLERRTRDRYGLASGDEVSPQQIATLFLDDETDWAQATARLYRAALSFMFGEMHTAASNEAHAMIFRPSDTPEEAEERRKRLKASRKAIRSNRPKTSARKSKSISAEDLDKLLTSLDERPTKYGSATRLWFLAGMLTGLRPCEWQAAKFDADKTASAALIVQNAKSSNERAHGRTRTLHLHKLSQVNLAVIAEHLENIKVEVESNGYENFYGGCRKHLRITANKLWPRRRTHPTLYTARHVFGSNAKDTFDRHAVAALMGHASTETAYAHYGKRHRSHGKIDVEPGQSDMDAVAARNKHRLVEGTGSCANSALGTSKLLISLGRSRH